MKLVEPFQSMQQASRSLDNGGRFFDILSRADDGVITTAELSKAAGVFTERQQSIIYFAMSIAALDETSRTRILESLTEGVLDAYEKYKPVEFMASEVERGAKLSQSVIVSGVPHYVESNTDFKGFIMIPVSTGKSMTMVMIPIMDKYDVYKVRDHVSSETFLIAHARSKEKLPEVQMKVGGIVKEIKAGKQPESKTMKFLESFYYSLS
jgi:hypothetical protein